MIFIRADANKIIGTGHIMRCKTIADALIENGVEIAFVTADHFSDEIIRDTRCKHLVLDTLWNDLHQEISGLEQLIDVYNPSLLLIDSYYVTEEYLAHIRKKSKIAYIDDLNKRCWPVSYLINYNVYSNVYDYSQYENTDTRLLLGTQYTPLRNEFVFADEKIIKKRVKNILISAGGADPENITKRIMDFILCDRELDDYDFHFILGVLNPRIEEIKLLAEQHDNIKLHINEHEMAKLMRSCDIAISASGTTLYELCSCGVPTITYTLADNQIIAAEQFENLNIMINAGDCRGNNGFIENLNVLLKQLINNYDLRQKMSYEMQKLVDGNGAHRIALELMRTS